MKKLLYLFLAITVACSDDDGNPCTYDSTLTTSEATNITDTSAILNGTVNVVSQNCDDPNNTEQGFVISTEIQPTINDTQINVNGTDISTTIEGLEPNTTYYVRSFLTNFLGEFYGNEVSFTTGEQGLNIGDLANGGIVFWIDPDDYTKGLVSALVGQGFVQWGCYGEYISEASETAVGSGFSNTMAIVNNCNEMNIAARVCNDLSLNGFDDWFLPSKDELNLMYENLHLNGLGGFLDEQGPPFYTGRYWSSSDGELNGEAAWNQNFDDGSQSTYDYGIKDNELQVRAIRRF